VMDKEGKYKAGDSNTGYWIWEGEKWISGLTVIKMLKQKDDDIQLLLEIIIQADPQAWENGNICGSIDEGTVLMERAVQEVRNRQ